MRIDAFLRQSPMFSISLTARRFDILTARLLEADGLNFLEGLVLAALFFEAPAPVKPSQLAETFGTTRGNVSHCIASLEARGFVQRRIDPEDARAYHLSLKSQGKKSALRVIGSFDKAQNHFEEEIGKSLLQETLDVIRRLAESAGPAQLEGASQRRAHPHANSDSKLLANARRTL